MLCCILCQRVVLPRHNTEAMVGVGIDQRKARNDVTLKFVPKTQKAVVEIWQTADSSEYAIKVA